MGIENLSGRTFDPLIQGDPGEILNLKEEAMERVKQDSVNFNEKGLDATKPVHHDKRSTVLFNASKKITINCTFRF